MATKVVRKLMKAEGIKIRKSPGYYEITNEETGEFYIGSSKNISARINHHQGNLLANKHSNKPLQASFNQAENKDVFRITVELTENVEEARRAEQKELSSRYLDDKCLNQKSTSFSEITNDLVNPDNLSSEKHRGVIASRRTLSDEEERDRRAKISSASKRSWKSDDFRRNIIEKNGDKVTVDGVTYNSVREASRALGGVAPQSIRKLMASGNQIKSSDIKRDNFRKVSVEGKVYASVTLAAQAYGIAGNTMVFRLQSSSPKWKDFFYL